MNETYIVIGIVIVTLSLLLLKTAYENSKLKKRVKQKEEEIEHMKRDQRICGDY